MAVTAAPTRKVTRLRGCRAGESYGQVSAGIEFDSSSDLLKSFNRYNKLIPTNHVQTGTCRSLYGPRIRSQSLHFGLQRLVNVAQHLNVRLHRAKLLSGKVNFRSRAHVDRHADGESRQQNHSKNNPGGNYSPAAPHLRARSKDLQRDLLHRSQRRIRARRYTLRLDSFVNPISI
jgi:hypothetical protein